ncbi:hypothetical protein [Paraflavitalea pollutisoli]|uniref:hypothetical protein n=1 Tax=Paraflavitalea pollutisoli TaxID=3034143 RepID=UPI0023EB0156|nr:hypothetical protein [Paraflavitalea sp. H1-2-19X]
MNITKTLTLIAFISCLASSCGAPAANHQLAGTWQSLWKEDMKLQIHFDGKNSFKTTLQRTGQEHTNYGWYAVQDNIFLVKDSIDLPLPVCNYTDTGKYRIQVGSDTLSFELIADTCEHRGLALRLAKFVRVK